MKPELWVAVAIPAASFLGTLAVVVVGFLYNNSRITDLRSDVTGRMSDLRVFLTDMQNVEAERQGCQSAPRRGHAAAQIRRAG